MKLDGLNCIVAIENMNILTPLSYSRGPPVGLAPHNICPSLFKQLAVELHRGKLFDEKFFF